MKTKFNKESRNLLIGMLLGDGTISSNYVYKLSYCEQQLDYLQWKINLLKNNGIRNNGIKEYISTCGYNKNQVEEIIEFVKFIDYKYSNNK